MRRRSFIQGGLAAGLVSAACQKKKSRGFSGFAFVSNYEGQAIAVVDLQTFTVVRHIRLGQSPTSLLAHPFRPSVLALTPATGTLHRIDLGTMAVEVSRAFTRTATAMRLDPSGNSLWLLAPAERKLVRIRLDTLDPDAIIALPEGCRDIDIAPESGLPYAAVNLGDSGRVAMMNLSTRKVQYELKVGAQTGPIRFLKNGKLLLAGSPADQLLVVFDVATGQRVVELPLSLKPERFCFKQDGGQLFITGAGQDAVAVVYPFQTQVAGTILAGHEPGAMATSLNPDFLFIANRASGEVTVLDIQTQKVRAVVPVGQDPDYICVTPDNNFALVLNRRSGDMAVIRVDAMAGRRTKAGPLFTMIPVGSMPVAAVVVEV